jgi:hypothetical protein
MVTKPIIWKSGGGTQSTAIAVLISQGKLPTPERAVIADTGRESSETWWYLNEYVRPLLWKVGLEVEVAPHSLATKDLYDTEGKTLIPAYTDSGMLSTFCSNEWKKRVVSRWLRQPERGYGPQRPIIEWIGFSRNEIGRCKPTDTKWIETHWPLIMGYGVCVSRAECVGIIADAGLPKSPRSACVHCPFRTDPEWLHQQTHWPKDHLHAVQIDKEIREKDSLNALWLHKSRKPLDEVDFTESESAQESLFGHQGGENCKAQTCWT